MESRSPSGHDRRKGNKQFPRERERGERERERESSPLARQHIGNVRGTRGGQASQPAEHFVNQLPVVVVKCEFGDLKAEDRNWCCCCCCQVLCFFFFSNMTSKE
jgi:hypothetical protein